VPLLVEAILPGRRVGWLWLWLLWSTGSRSGDNVIGREGGKGWLAGVTGKSGERGSSSLSMM
jgi:hypothetical protein